jgi:hypothetical protein
MAMSSLREQFEAWLETVPEVRVGLVVTQHERKLMFEAYQAGHAASGRDELLAALEDIVNEMAITNDNGKRVTAKIEWEYLVAAREAIKKARGEA